MRRGVSLVEVFIVISIVALLMGVLIPATMRARDAALRASSQNNVRQAALAVQNFASAHGGLLPTSAGKG